MDITERFIKYVKINSSSSEEKEAEGKVPSSECQFDMARELYSELLELGLSNVCIDDHAYVYAELPASDACEDCPSIMFNAHIDTVPDFSGENVCPRIIPNYDGEAIVLGDSGRTLSPEMFPDLKELKGQTLITTDGTTVLGSDDKAGIAEIICAVERVIAEKLPHGRIALCFSPDEEIGHGAALMDLEKVNADFGFTVDGGEPWEINYETFNAADALWEINGINVHPGSAKNKMLNASLVAMEINSMLPACDVPSKTENYEGFFHLLEMSGDIEKANLRYIVRDHDAALFEGRKKLLRHIEKTINEKYGSGTAVLRLVDYYRNMGEIIRNRPEILELAKRAVIATGYEPKYVPVRGGTDGSQLTFRGLPCPNLGTGGYACHGPYEHITSERLEKVSELVYNIIRLAALNQ